MSDFTVFPATIDWGDGTTTMATITQPGGRGSPFAVSGNHTYPEEGGPFTVTVTVRDVGGSIGVGFATITVADAP